MNNEIEKRIHEYAEGNPQLESFLKTCSFRGLDSIVCSNSKKDGNPYMFFEYRDDFKDETKRFINYILKNIESDTNDINMQYTMNNDLLTVSLKFPNKEVSSVFYTVFSSLRLPSNVDVPDKLSTFEKIAKTLNNNGLAVTLDIIDNKEYLFMYSKEGTFKYDRDECPTLDEYIDYLNQSNNALLPNLACHCDVDSMNRFNAFLAEKRKGDVVTVKK